MTSQPHPHRSPRPSCPEPRCGKVWAPDKKTARQLRAEIADETGSHYPVRYYEHCGGWHWTREAEKPAHPWF